MQGFTRLTNDLDQSQQQQPVSQRCYRSALGCINILLICVGALLIGIAAYGKQHTRFVTLPLLAGFLVSGIILILLSMVGLVGISKQNQVILFVYMFAIIILFLVLMCVSVAALSMSSNQQHVLIRKGWLALDVKQRNHVEMKLKCCGLEKGDSGEDWCKNVLPLTYNGTTSCFNKLKEPIAKAAQCSGGVGLFFSLMLLIAVYATVRHRNLLQEQAILERDVFL